MKALSTSETANFVETLRQSCGGHGYMGIKNCNIFKIFGFHLVVFLFFSCLSPVSSGFPRLYAVATASETYEGENTVLWLQVARYFQSGLRH